MGLLRASGLRLMNARQPLPVADILEGDASVLVIIPFDPAAIASIGA